MNALADAPSFRDTSAARMDAPCVAFVTPHKATYLKPLYEGFAGAQPEPWRTLIVWPGSHRSEHPDEMLTPAAPNLRIERVVSRRIGRRNLAFGGVARLLETAKPSLVFIHEYAAFSLAGLWYAKRHRLPVVVQTEVGSANRWIFGMRTRLWHSFCSRWVDGIVAACPAAHLPPSGRKLPSIAAYHAVDSRLYRPLPKRQGGPVVFGYLGQLIPRKGLDCWMAAARHLRELGHENFKLRIIGGGDESWIRHQVSSHGLDDKVEWCGFLSGAQLREAVGTSDVFVLPSRADTYAAVVHEAACLALPLLISRHAGAAEAIVRNGENGFIIDPENAEEFAHRMLLMLDEDFRAKMSAAARAAGEEMSAHRRGEALWHWMDCQFGLVQG